MLSSRDTILPPRRDHLFRTPLLALALAILWPASAGAQMAVEYYHTDALGSVRAVTKQVNGQWQVVARYDYMPFGEEVPPPQVAQPYKRLFTGKERDTETGLDYVGARYLRPMIGRFTTPDPAMTIEKNLVDPQRWNRYGYVLNNPAKFTDPDGRVPVPVPVLHLERNAAVRDSVYYTTVALHGVVAATILDGLIGAVLPRDKQEQLAAVGSAIFGMAAPLELPAVAVAGSGLLQAGGKTMESGAANALGVAAAAESRVLQSGGNTMESGTANALNKYFEVTLDRKIWGRALEALKKDAGLRNEFHGRILRNGNYVDANGKLIGNIGDYLK